MYSTALYIRLSILDGGNSDGNSIINQQDMLKQYVTNNPEFILKEIFVDNGETGTNFHRGAWHQLMKACYDGKINCIIVKDLSRLGRNYIETGNYLDYIFPMLNVRLIAITDGYDNINLTNSERLVTSLKNLVNDIYAKDISNKICASIHTKQKNGEFIGSTACYGYLKIKNKLIINPETACIVRQIFKWKAEGVGNTTICRRLEAQGIPSPNKYKYLKGILKNPKFLNCTWAAETIAVILRNTVYLGHMSQGKKKNALHEAKAIVNINPKDWIIVKNTHAPIISQELFDAVNDVLVNRRLTFDLYNGKYMHLNKSANILKGFIFCANCGKALKRMGVINKNKEEFKWFYECRLHKDLKFCSKKFICETDLHYAINEALRIQIDTCVDTKNIVSALNPNHNDKEARRISGLRLSLYEDYVNNVISTLEYKNAIEKIKTNTDMKQTSINYEVKFNSNSVKALIKRIEVHRNQKINIIFNFHE